MSPPPASEILAGLAGEGRGRAPPKRQWPEHFPDPLSFLRRLFPSVVTLPADPGTQPTARLGVLASPGMAPVVHSPSAFQIPLKVGPAGGYEFNKVHRGSVMNIAEMWSTP